MISVRVVARMAPVAAAVCVALVSAASAAVNIETVHVGNTRNTSDTRYATPGFGAVDCGYNIGKYEVTAGQYTAFLNAVAATDTYGLYNTEMWLSGYGCKIERTDTGSGYSYSVAADWANRPVNCVTFWDACRFGNWLHNGQPTGLQNAATTEDGTYTLDGYNGVDGRDIQRNPGWKWAVTSEDEWYKAAYHQNDGDTGNYFDYPTSINTAPGQDMNDASGNNANYFTAPGTYPIDWPYYTTVAGEFQDSGSPYGTFDQGGNVWEWNEAIPYQDATCASRGLRGGSFYNSYDTLLAAYRFSSAYPTDDGIGFGFRVSEVPEPATLGLLVLGGLGLLRRRAK